MKFTKYSKYVPDAAGEMSMEDLLNALSDYLLQSGFQNSYLNFYDMQQGDHTLEELQRAIQQALESGEMEFDDEQMQEMLDRARDEGTMEELVNRIIERMQAEDFISVGQPFDPSRPSTAPG